MQNNYSDSNFPHINLKAVHTDRDIKIKSNS